MDPMFPFASSPRTTAGNWKLTAFGSGICAVFPSTTIGFPVARARLELKLQEKAVTANPERKESLASRFPGKPSPDGIVPRQRCPPLTPDLVARRCAGRKFHVLT